MFSSKCLETSNFTRFTKSNCCQIRKTNRPWPKFNQLWMFRKCQETWNLTCFTTSKWHQSDQNIISSIDGHDKSAYQIVGYSSYPFSWNAPNPYSWPVSLSQSGTKMSKIKKLWATGQHWFRQNWLLYNSQTLHKKIILYQIWLLCLICWCEQDMMWKRGFSRTYMCVTLYMFFQWNRERHNNLNYMVCGSQWLL